MHRLRINAGFSSFMKGNLICHWQMLLLMNLKKANLHFVQSLFKSLFSNFYQCTSLIAQLVKELACARDPFDPGLQISMGEGVGYPLQYSRASLVAQLVKNPPAIWEIWV